MFLGPTKSSDAGAMRRPLTAPPADTDSFVQYTQTGSDKLGGYMPSIDEVRAKVQRILTSNGSVRLGRDGEFILDHESASVIVEVEEGFGEGGTLVSFLVPMVGKVPLTPALYEWMATEGQDFRIGGTFLLKDEDNKTGMIFFRYAIVGDDLDESELLAAVYVSLFTCNDLDNNLQKRFGGELYGE